MPAAKRNEIQWLRAIAALEVVLWHSDLITKHFSDHHLHDSPIYQPIGGVGVELFFIVSGYVICMRAPTYASGVSFFVSRVVRLFPMYWIFTSLVLLAFTINPAWRLHNLDPSWPLIIQSYLILPQLKDPILGVGWTLEHEMVFYILAALFMTLFVKASLSARTAFAYFLLGLGLIGFATGSARIPRFWDYHLVSPYMIAFAFGWLMRCAEEQYGKQDWRKVVPFLAAGLTGFWLAGPENVHLFYRIALSVGVFFLFIWIRSVFATDNLANRWGSRIGDASFSIYLSHWFVLSALGKVFGVLDLPAILEVPVRLGGIAICGAVGYIIFVFLEKPIDRLLRGSSQSKAKGRMGHAAVEYPMQMPGLSVRRAILGDTAKGRDS